GGAAARLSATLICGVRDDPVDPGGEGGISTKRIDLPDHGQEGVLQRFLGILRVPRDPRGETAGAVTVNGYQIRGSRWITAAKGRHERAILVDPCRHHAWAFPLHLFELVQSTPLHSKRRAKPKRVFLLEIAIQLAKFSRSVASRVFRSSRGVRIRL